MQDWFFGAAILTWTYMAAQANGARLIGLFDSIATTLSQTLAHMI